jgi:hypothetical protein
MNISKRWYFFGSSSWITMIQRVISWFRLGQFSEDYPFGRKILAAVHLAQTTTDRKICNVHLFINFPDLVARRLSKIGTWKWSSFCYRNSKEHEDSIVQSFQTIRNQWPIWACLGKFPCHQVNLAQITSNNLTPFTADLCLRHVSKSWPPVSSLPVVVVVVVEHAWYFWIFTVYFCLLLI